MIGAARGRVPSTRVSRALLAWTGNRATGVHRQRGYSQDRGTEAVVQSGGGYREGDRGIETTGAARGRVPSTTVSRALLAWTGNRATGVHRQRGYSQDRGTEAVVQSGGGYREGDRGIETTGAARGRVPSTTVSRALLACTGNTGRQGYREAEGVQPGQGYREAEGVQPGQGYRGRGGGTVRMGVQRGRQGYRNDGGSKG